MSARPYKCTGIDFKFSTRDRILRHAFAGPYKRCRFQLPRTSPRVWGQGRSRVNLVRAKRDAPLFWEPVR